MSRKVINVVVNSDLEFEYLDVSSAELDENLFETFTLIKGREGERKFICPPLLITESQSEIFAVAWIPNLKMNYGGEMLTLKEWISTMSPDIIALIDTLPRITKEEFYT